MSETIVAEKQQVVQPAIQQGGQVTVADKPKHLSAMPEVPAAPSESRMLMSAIVSISQNPSFDPEKLERMMALYERMEGMNAQKAYQAAMAAAQSEMKPVARDATNDQTKSQYARLEAIADQITPIYTKHGFSLSFGTAESPKEGHYRVTCKIMHEGGYRENEHADIPIDGAGLRGNSNKTATHAFGSTTSYGRRYLKLLIFDIATRDDDDGNAAGGNGPISEDQQNSLRAMIDEVGGNIPAFCKYFRIDKLGDLPAGQYDRAVKALEKKRGQQQ